MDDLEFTKEYYDFGIDGTQTYSNTCTCGFTLLINGQQDNCPEYYSRFVVKCPSCGSSIPFSMPCN